MVWRASEGKQGRAAQIARQSADYPGRPSVQRVGGTVGEFRRGRDMRPEAGLGRAKQDKRPGSLRGAVAGLRPECAENRQPFPVRASGNA